MLKNEPFGVCKKCCQKLSHRWPRPCLEDGVLFNWKLCHLLCGSQWRIKILPPVMTRFMTLSCWGFCSSTWLKQMSPKLAWCSTRLFGYPHCRNIMEATIVLSWRIRRSLTDAYSWQSFFRCYRELLFTIIMDLASVFSSVINVDCCPERLAFITRLWPNLNIPISSQGVRHGMAMPP